jgi:predicted polyphosphate/ATP-dependent NAD kinase
MRIRWQLKRTPDGYEGTVFIDINPGALEGGGNVALTGRDKTKAKALGKAAIVAERTLAQLEANPFTRALMPPGAGLAIAGLKAIAKSGAMGKAREAAVKLGGHQMFHRVADAI